MSGKTKKVNRSPLGVVKEFMAAWEEGALERLLDTVHADIIFIGTTGPEPGRTFTGKQAFASVVTPLLSPTAKIRLKTLELFDAGDTIIATWETHDTANQHSNARMIGIDIFRVADGKIILKDAYRKSY